MGKIDKFSFIIGAFMVILIIGCVAQIGGTDGAGRYEFIEPNQIAYDYSDSGTKQMFGVFDSETGTVNVWYNANNPTEVSVHVFQSAAPQ